MALLKCLHHDQKSIFHSSPSLGGGLVPYHIKSCDLSWLFVVALEVAITNGSWAIEIVAHTCTYQKMVPLSNLYDDLNIEVYRGLAFHSQLREGVLGLQSEKEML